MVSSISQTRSCSRASFVIFRERAANARIRNIVAPRQDMIWVATTQDSEAACCRQAGFLHGARPVFVPDYERHPSIFPGLHRLAIAEGFIRKVEEVAEHTLPHVTT